MDVLGDGAPQHQVGADQEPVLRGLRRSWPVVAAGVVVAALLAYLLSGLQGTTYQATSRVVLSATSAYDPLGRASFVDPSRFVATQQSVLLSQPVLGLAVTALADGTDAGELADGASVTAAAGSGVLSVAAQGPTAAEAKARADALAQAYSDYSTAQVQAATQRALDSLAGTASTEPGVVADLATQATSIRLQQAAYGNGVQLVEDAIEPTSPTTPAPTRNALVAGVLALLVGLGVIAARSGRGSELTGATLASVPVPSARVSGQKVPTGQDHALALVGLQYAGVHPGRPVQLARAGRTADVASVAVGLAAAASTAGTGVLVVDALPARPLARRTGGLDGQPGLLELGGSSRARLVGLPEGPDAAGAVRPLLDLADHDELVVLVTADPSADPEAMALLGVAGSVVAVADGASRLADLGALSAVALLAGTRVCGALETRRRHRGWRPLARAALAPVPESAAH